MSLISESPITPQAHACLKASVDKALEAGRELREAIRNMNGTGERFACAIASTLKVVA